MPEMLTIDAIKRETGGTAGARRIRRSDDQVPGVVYGGDEPPVHFQLEYRRVAKVMEDEQFFSQIVSLNMENESQRVVLRELQRHPATDKVIHIDFLRVSEDRELNVMIPLHFLNEEECIGVRLNGGVASRNLNEVEVSCLPRDLPEFIEIDLEDMDIGDSVHLSDLDLPDGISLVAMTRGDGHDDLIVNVHMPRGMALDEEEEVEADEEEGLETDEDADADEPTEESE